MYPIKKNSMNGGSDFSDITALDAVKTISIKPAKTSTTSEVPTSDESLNFTIKVYKSYKIQIYKPLILLKLALLCWYGAGSVVATFLLVFFKQRGMTLSELSIIYALTPAVQFLGPTISGIIADKIGRSKPVLVANLILCGLVAVGMLCTPSMNIVNCDPQPINLKCHHREFGRLIAKTSCDVPTESIDLTSCNVTCPENVTQYCNGQNIICEILEGNEDPSNFSLSVFVNWAYKLKNKCYYNVTSMSYKNTTHSWCNVPHKMYCRISCLMQPDSNCSELNSGRGMTLKINMVLLIFFFTVFSNCYRFMDVTAMALVKEHNSDFGRERFFSITGVLIFTPVAGYIVDKTTVDSTEKNYEAAFYMFIAMLFLVLLVTYKLKVSIKPPGKNMWKKSFRLIKNPDVLAFVFVLFVLGTSWGFSKNFTFWFLEGMNPPSFLLGLIPAVSALYGLPFLLTSNWWVKKIGTMQIFILGLLGYVGAGIGYSFLYDPWLSLLIEISSIATYHLLWVSVIVHSNNIAPEGLKATVISIAGGIHYSLGKGSGGLVGGFIMDIFGGRIAYRVMAIACLASAVLYALYLYIRRSCYAVRAPLELNGSEIVTYVNEDEDRNSYALRSKS